MKRLNIRSIICVVIFVILCITMLNFLYRFTLPQTSGQEAASFATANASSILAGAYAVGFLFVTGMFLFTLSIKKPDWLFLLLIVSFGFLIMNTMIDVPCGSYFLKQSTLTALNVKVFQYIPSHAILLYLLLKQDKQFWYYFFYNSKLFSIALVLSYLFSYLIHGSFYKAIDLAFRNISLPGQLEQLATWITILLLFTCTIITFYCYIKDGSATKVQENAMDVKNDIINDIYGILKDTIATSSNMNLMIQQEISTMEDSLEKKQYKQLKEQLETFRQHSASSFPRSYCENPVIQLLLSTYDSIFQKKQIAFTVDAVLPAEIGDVEQDLYKFLINLLNNAMKANENITNVQNRFLHLTLHYESGFLSICSENPYVGVLKTDSKDNHLTTEQTLHREALDLQQMKQIALKYNSTLSIETEAQIFTIRTALKL